MSNAPFVVLKSRFLTKSSSKSANFSYNDFLNYMDRENTKKEINDFSNYNEYMEKGNEKTSGLFSNNKDHLTDKEKGKLKDIFKRSQNKGSILWQDVISFDNKQLQETGIINGKDIDEKQLKNVARESINSMLENEGIKDSSIWTGSIHYDTDNIHIHLATVQTHNFRERGFRKPKTLERAKSKVANKLIDRSQENEKINKFIRNTLVQSNRDEPINTLKNKITNPKMVNQFNKIYNSLPNDKRMWMYNMNAIKHLQPEINKLTDMYISKNHSKDFNDFSNNINKNIEVYKKIYGNSRAIDYKNNVYKDMYTRMGNSILTEMKKFDSEKNNISNINFKKKRNKLQSKYAIRKEMQNSVYHLDRYMNDNLQNIKNQNEHEQLQKEQEMNR